MYKKTIVIGGPCAVEGLVMENTVKGIAQSRDVAESYGIDFKLRGGGYKPRTGFVNSDNHEKIFEGLGQEGLIILHKLGMRYNLPTVSEIMSELDIPEFIGRVNTFQIGARSSQAFALIKRTGVQADSALLKSAMNGFNEKEAKGSLERLVFPEVGEPDRKKPEEIIYCVRGQSRPNPVSEVHKKLIEKELTELYRLDKNQHPDYRNLNMIDVIKLIRKIPFFKKYGIRILNDPSHTIGGKTEEARRDIGKFAIKAITEYNYDGVIVEVNNDAATAKCDGEQALPVSLNEIDWGRTQYVAEPRIKPISFVEIIGEIMKYRVANALTDKTKIDLEPDLKRLAEIKYT